MHILVADDDLPSVKLTSFLLEEAGYRVFKAYDGPSIMQALEQYKHGGRVDMVMNPLIGPLDEESLEQLAAFFASRPHLHNTPHE